MLCYVFVISKREDVKFYIEVVIDVLEEENFLYDFWMLVNLEVFKLYWGGVDECCNYNWCFCCLV